jgi:hypothetical protein
MLLRSISFWYPPGITATKLKQITASSKVQEKKKKEKKRRFHPF